MPTRYPFLGPPPLAFAHRGGAAPGDENTLAAFGRAVALGYRYLETDVRATRDGVAVVFHDAALHRLTGEPGRLAALSAADLATLRVGGAAAVPRLDEVLDAWPQAHLNLDLKCDAAVAPTLAAVDRVGAAHRVLLASFSDARVRRVRRAVGPAVATALGPREVLALWLASRAARAPGPRPAAAGVAAAQVPERVGRLRVVDARFVARAHAAGLQVHVWTVDDPAAMHRLLDLGVDGLMTDRLHVLRDVYRARGHWAA